MRVELTSPTRKGRCFTLKLTRLFSSWGSNPRPSAHKTDALPTELHEMMLVLIVGFDNQSKKFNFQLGLGYLNRKS